MTKEVLIKRLEALAQSDNPEGAHIEADDLLMWYIADEEIQDAYDSITKWYS